MSMSSTRGKEIGKCSKVTMGGGRERVTVTAFFVLKLDVISK